MEPLEILLECRFCSSNKLPGDVDPAVTDSKVPEELVCCVHHMKPKSFMLGLAFRRGKLEKFCSITISILTEGLVICDPCSLKQRLTK